jgi:hypothetical protein
LAASAGIGACVGRRVGFAAAVAPPGDPIEIPVRQRQLFLDDSCVAKIDRLRSTMHSPAKRGAVIRPDQPWECALETRSSPAWDDRQKRYKLWLITLGEPDACGASYAESDDGLHWRKPSLGQYSWRGSRQNNFLLVDPKSAGWPHNAIENVVLDPAERDPSRRFKGFLGATWRRPMASPDGIHWKLFDAPALQSQDESNLSRDPLTDVFIATLKTGGPFGRAHAIFTSKDFLHWVDTGTVFHADEEDQRRAVENIRRHLADRRLRQPVYNHPADYHADIYNFAVFRYEGLYIGLPAVYHRTGDSRVGRDDGFHLVQLASSRDLRTWRRLGDRQAFLAPSPADSGVYDTLQVLPPSAPLVRGDQLWFYYCGLKYREGPPKPERDWGGICLAVLRRDGFVSLDADDQPGTLVTHRFAVPARRLFVNADASRGDLAVELLEANGRIAATSAPIVGDQPAALVRWRSGDLAVLQGRHAALRFTIRNAKAYSFWFDD